MDLACHYLGRPLSMCTHSFAVLACPVGLFVCLLAARSCEYMFKAPWALHSLLTRFLTACACACACAYLGTTSLTDCSPVSVELPFLELTLIVLSHESVNHGVLVCCFLPSPLPPYSRAPYWTFHDSLPQQQRVSAVGVERSLCCMFEPVHLGFLVCLL